MYLVLSLCIINLILFIIGRENIVALITLPKFDKKNAKHQLYQHKLKKLKFNILKTIWCNIFGHVIVQTERYGNEINTCKLCNKSAARYNPKKYAIVAITKEEIERAL